MSQSAKAVVALFVLVFLVASLISWLDVEWAPFWKWSLRFVFPFAALGFGALLGWAEFRKDKVPNFLRQVTKSYFEREGFCFSMAPIIEEGVCYILVAFQNRYERPCQAQIVIKPAPGFFLTRPKIGGMAIPVECGPAAFGTVRVPFAAPPEYRGKVVPFEVGANTFYPQGRGRMLRFKEGLAAGPANFNSVGANLLTLTGLMVGVVRISKPARAKITLPMGVKENLPDQTPVTVQTVWKLGDPVKGPSPIVSGLG